MDPGGDIYALFPPEELEVTMRPVTVTAEDQARLQRFGHSLCHVGQVLNTGIGPMVFPFSSKNFVFLY